MKYLKPSFFLQIRRVDISSDRKKVFPELFGMKPRHVVYLRLNLNTMKSRTGRRLRTTEAWYTLNNIPQESGKLSKNYPGEISAASFAQHPVLIN